MRQQPLPIEGDGEQEFKVEAIVGHRVFWAQFQYMVEFVGYDATEIICLAEE